MAHRMHLKARLNSKAKAPLPFVRDEATKEEDSKPVSCDDQIGENEYGERNFIVPR